MVSLRQGKRQHTRRKSYMQQVNPSHERQKSTRDKTERNLEKIGQILIIVCLQRIQDRKGSIRNIVLHF